MRAASMTRSSSAVARGAAAAPARRAIAAPLRRISNDNNTATAARRHSSLAPPPRALELDWSDPDTLIGALGGVLGLVVGIGAPLFYISRDKKDEGEERKGERAKKKSIEREAWRA